MEMKSLSSFFSLNDSPPMRIPFPCCFLSLNQTPPKCLHTRIDILRFRATCCSFRCFFPLPSKTLSFKIPNFVNPSHISHFLLREGTIYAIEPLKKIYNTHITTKTWLLKVEESKPGHVLLKDPLHGSSFKDISHKLRNSLNLLDYCVKEISKVHRLRLVPADKAEDRNSEIDYFDKVVISSCLDEIHHEFAVLGLTSGNVFVRRTGEEYFTHIGGAAEGFYFDDIVYHNEKFYAFGKCSSMMGRTLTVDSESLELKEIATPLWLKETSSKYMVKSRTRSNLYLICKSHRTMHFIIFKLYEEKRQWVQVLNEFEDGVFFVGDDCSFYVSAKEFKGCKGNCVYFIDKIFSKDKEVCPGSDAGIYDLEDLTIAPFLWYSKIFWPPPTWLKQNSNSARC